MTPEEKQILFRDISVRLSYGVICKGINLYLDTTKNEYVNMEVSGPLTNIEYNYCTLGIMTKCKLSTIKPYLRPMESMTDEEIDTYTNTGSFLHANGIPYNLFYNNEGLGFLLSNHFDIFGLIPKKLAVEVTKENNPYKNDI
jgi:hypothetical protein